MAFQLGTDTLTTRILSVISASPNPDVVLQPDTLSRLDRLRGIVDRHARGSHAVYGINTGFGYLAQKRIPAEDLAELQVRILRSHAAGVGRPMGESEVRALLILRLHTLLRGGSGVRREVVDRLALFLREDILPWVPIQGSVGASGDLAPLAHLALPLIGEGWLLGRSGRMGEGDRVPAADYLAALGVEPLVLAPKEGLALVNGTHFMTTLGALAHREAEILCDSATLISALSLDGFRGTAAAFDPAIHALRPHAGQVSVAASLRRAFSDLGADAIMRSHKDCDAVQDPYSFRCVPQVHGATLGVLDHVGQLLTIELNAVTDNPIVCEDGRILSGGNFHGQPVAMALDYLAIAVAELGSISERRIEKLTNPAMSRLPAMIVRDPGLNSGFMMPHVTAAALVSENKILAHPASVDSIPTSADKEDHVSMGPIAARKAREINQNVARILAIELLAAAQAVDLLAPLRPGPLLAELHQALRLRVPTFDVDRIHAEDIERTAAWITAGGVARLWEETT